MRKTLFETDETEFHEPDFVLARAVVREGKNSGHTDHFTHRSRFDFEKLLREYRKEI